MFKNDWAAGVYKNLLDPTRRSWLREWLEAAYERECANLESGRLPQLYDPRHQADPLAYLIQNTPLVVDPALMTCYLANALITTGDWKDQRLAWWVMLNAVLDPQNSKGWGVFRYLIGSLQPVEFAHPLAQDPFIHHLVDLMSEQMRQPCIEKETGVSLLFNIDIHVALLDRILESGAPQSWIQGAAVREMLVLNPKRLAGLQHLCEHLGQWDDIYSMVLWGTGPTAAHLSTVDASWAFFLTADRWEDLNKVSHVCPIEKLPARLLDLRDHADLGLAPELQAKLTALYRRTALMKGMELSPAHKGSPYL